MMKIRGFRQIDESERADIDYFARQFPEPFNISYDTDTFTAQVNLEIKIATALSLEVIKDAMTGAITPVVIRRQLESVKLEAERLLRELCGIYELPSTLVTAKQYREWYK